MTLNTVNQPWERQTTLLCKRWVQSCFFSFLKGNFLFLNFVLISKLSVFLCIIDERWRDSRAFNICTNLYIVSVHYIYHHIPCIDMGAPHLQRGEVLNRYEALYFQPRKKPHNICDPASSNHHSLGMLHGKK